MRYVGWAAIALAAAAPARAEVKSAEAGGFVVAMKATVAAPPAAVWAALVKPAGWWNMEHSYSSVAANMTIDPRVGGCWCEKMPAQRGGVEHGRVIQVIENRLLRMAGGLGPFQSMAAAGVLNWELKPAGSGTEISMSYSIGGYIPGGAQAIAPMVDKVMQDQFDRLAKFVDKGR